MHPTPTLSTVPSRFDPALLSSAAVWLVLLPPRGATGLPLGTTLALVAAQSVAGLYVGTHYRLRLSLQVGGILLLTALLAGACGGSLPAAVLGVGVLALSFGYWRQLFPANAGDIIIPASVVFFIVYSYPDLPRPLVPIAQGSLIGLGCQLAYAGVVLPFRRPATAMPGHAPLVAGALRESAGYQSGPTLKLAPALAQYSLRLGLLLAFGVTVCRYLPYSHSYWLPFTMVVVSQVNSPDATRRIRERLGGTLMGCAAGGALLLFLPPRPVQVGLILVSNGLFIYALRRNYRLASAAITLFVLLTFGLGRAADASVALERLGFTLLAGACVYLSWRLVPPAGPSST